MKRLSRKATFIIIVVLMIITVVTIYGFNHHKLVNKVQPVNKCVSNCTNAVISPSPFIPNQELNEQQRFLSTIAHKLSTTPQNNTFEYTLLRAYGAVFLNQELGVKLPQKVILATEQEAQEFQTTLTMGQVDGTRDCYLQKSAADALNKARTLQIIPLKSGFSGDCTRNFATNLNFWRKYANNQVFERVQQGQETKILGTVAPPGTSQHLWGLAIDLRVSNQEQRKALNQNGWFQTVENDLPHWTYIGWTEENLPKFGLKNKVVNGIIYWVTPI
ncbi:D-alanyl-D-alanine carboxypeptidase family protein [Cylindrospermum sp. FACHB-282]|uniref:D-alanyl-D-alanine carboxypeptidase family protein n=1 Tax=Cylindrospermum sp. FACHB-282 TaxID=2692794 RepID=UPI001687E18D|nr:D-alanyl-D-alanine carboxypeptidase family protein [Cylindrospermum sp. FACHB-282]MBD2388699.1 D-alanyl-D-alanine carboxypeptidase family protein [Cylindrospermum sp. FACHB-282]